MSKAFQEQVLNNQFDTRRYDYSNMPEYKPPEEVGFFQSIGQNALAGLENSLGGTAEFIGANMASGSPNYGSSPMMGKQSDVGREFGKSLMNNGEFLMNDAEERLQQYGSNGMNWGGFTDAITNPNYWLNPRGATADIFNGIGSSAPEMLLGMMAGGAGALATRAILANGGEAAIKRGIGKAAAEITGKDIIQAFLGGGPKGKALPYIAGFGVGGAAAEAPSDAGSNYAEILAKVQSEMNADETPKYPGEAAQQEALRRMNLLAAEEMPALMASNAITGALVGGKVAGALGKNSKDVGARALANMLVAGADMTGEGLTEVAQTSYANDMLYKPRGDILNPSTWDADQKESFRAGFVGALLPSAGGAVRGTLFPEDESKKDKPADVQPNANLFGAGTASYTTQGPDIDAQVEALKPGWSAVIPQVFGVLENRFGITGAQISSGGRTREHNAEVGGSETSYHISDEGGGDALDIVLPDNISKEEAEKIKEEFEDSGVFSEVMFHDAGSGNHLHLGGLKTDSIGDSYGTYSGNSDLDAMINEVAEQYGVDPSLLAAIADQESGFDQNANSGAGAIGIMQLMPDTAAGLGVDPNDLRGNLEGGAKYLRQMLDAYDGDVEKALAAYNAGPGSLDSVGGDISQLSDETQNYVPSVLKKYNKYKGQTRRTYGRDGSVLNWDSVDDDYKAMDYFPDEGEESQGTANEFLENLAKLGESENQEDVETAQKAMDALEQYSDDDAKLTQAAEELGYKQTVDPAEVHSRVPMKPIVRSALQNGEVTFATQQAADIFASTPVGQTMQRDGKTFKVTDDFSNNEIVKGIQQETGTAPYSPYTGTATVATNGQNGISVDPASANAIANGQSRTADNGSSSPLTNEDVGRLASIMPNLPAQVQEQIRQAMANGDVETVRNILDGMTADVPLNTSTTDVNEAIRTAQALSQIPESLADRDGMGAVKLNALQQMVESGDLDGLNRINKYMADNLRRQGIDPVAALNGKEPTQGQGTNLPAVRGERMPSTDVEEAVPVVEGEVQDVITPEAPYTENQLEAPAIESEHISSDEFKENLNPVERGFMDYLDKVFENVQMGFDDVLDYLKARQNDIFSKRMEIVIQQGVENFAKAFRASGGRIKMNEMPSQEVQNAWQQLLSMRANFGATLANAPAEVQNEYMRVEQIVKDYLNPIITEQCKNNESWRKLNYAVTGLETIAKKARAYERSLQEEGKRSGTKGYRDVPAQTGEALENSAAAWADVLHKNGTTEGRIKAFLNTLGSSFTKNNHGMTLRGKSQYKGKAMNKAGRIEALIQDGGRVEDRGGKYFAVAPNGSEIQVTKGEHNYYEWLKKNGFGQQKEPEPAWMNNNTPMLEESNFRDFKHTDSKAELEQERAARQAENQGNKKAPSSKEQDSHAIRNSIIEIANRAWNDKSTHERVSFKPSDKLKAKIKELFGHDINEVFITSDDIRHMKNHHSEKEEQRGQENLTPESLGDIYDTVNDFDDATKERDDKQGNQSVLVVKRNDGSSFALLIERGKKKAEIKTYYRAQKKTSVMSDAKSPNLNARSDSQKSTSALSISHEQMKDKENSSESENASSNPQSQNLEANKSEIDNEDEIGTLYDKQLEEEATRGEFSEDNYHGYMDDKSDKEQARIKKVLSKPVGEKDTVFGNVSRKERLEKAYAEGMYRVSRDFTGLSLIHATDSSKYSVKLTKTEVEYFNYLEDEIRRDSMADYLERKADYLQKAAKKEKVKNEQQEKAGDKAKDSSKADKQREQAKTIIGMIRNAGIEVVTDAAKVKEVLGTSLKNAYKDSLIQKLIISYKEGEKAPDLTLTEQTINGKKMWGVAFVGEKPKNYIPKKIGRAYKLMEMWPDGSLHALFAGTDKSYKIGEWNWAQGFTPDESGGIKSMKLAPRYGWHMGTGVPATHHLMGIAGADGKGSTLNPKIGYPSKSGVGHPKGSKRVWVEVHYDATNDYSDIAEKNPGDEKDIRGLIPFGGYYMFQESNLSNWIIASSIKFDHVLNESERQDILDKAGYDEELMWRTYVVPKMLNKQINPLKAAVATGWKCKNVGKASKTEKEKAKEIMSSPDAPPKYAGWIPVSKLSESELEKSRKKLEQYQSVYDDNQRMISEKTGGKDFGYKTLTEEEAAAERKRIREAVYDNPEWKANEEALQNGDGTQYFTTDEGEVFGFVKDGVIYLDPNHMNTNTPIHEYTHVWDNVVREENPELWERGKELMKQSPVWDEVVKNPAYADIVHDEDLVASEVHARLTGEKGELLVDSLSKNGSKSLAEKLKAWAKEYWQTLKDHFTKWGVDEASKITLDEFISMPLTDLANSVNVGEVSTNHTSSNTKNRTTIQVTGDEYGKYKDITDLRKKAIKFYSDNLQGTSVENKKLGTIDIDEIGMVNFTGSGKRKIKNTSAKEEKLLLVKHLPKLIQEATNITESAPEKAKHNDEYFYYLHTSANVKGMNIPVTITLIKRNDNRIQFYNHILPSLENSNKKEPLVSSAPESSINEALGTPTVSGSSVSSIPQKQKNGKNSSKNTNPKNKAVVWSKDGKEYNVHYEVRPESEIVTSNDIDGFTNPEYPKDLQPRDRGRAGNRTVVINHAKNLNPALLTVNTMLNMGAPLIREDGVMLNGNGRLLSIRKAVKDGTDNHYKDYIMEHAEELGLDPADIEGMENPVLVKVVDDNLTAEDVDSIINDTSGGQRMSASEQAKADAKKIKGTTLWLYRYKPSKEGELTGVNTDFLATLLGEILPEDEINAYYDKNGDINQEGQKRAQRALFALAYGDDHLIDVFAESTSDLVKNFINALSANAPYLAKLQQSIRDGNSYDLNLRDTIVKAVTALRDAVLTDTPAESVWRDISIWEEMELTPEARAMAQAIDGFRRSGKKVANFIGSLIERGFRHGDPNQVPMFEGTDNHSLMEDINRAKEMVENGGQSSLFEDLTENPVNKHSADYLKENGNTNTELDKLDKVPMDKLRKSEQKLVKFGAAIGVKVHFVESSDKGNRGVFTHNGEIYINRKAAVPAKSIFVHEFVHWLKASPENAGAYDVLHACLENLDGIVSKERIEKYRKSIFDGEHMTDEEIAEEIICDAMSNSESAEKLMRAINNIDASLATKIGSYLKAMWDKFCKAIGFQPNKLSREQTLPNELSVSEMQKADAAFNRILMNLKDENGKPVFKKVGTELFLAENNSKPSESYSINPIGYTYAMAHSRENGADGPIANRQGSADNVSVEFEGDTVETQRAFDKYLTQGLKDLTRQTIEKQITENIKDFDKLSDPVELDKALNSLPFFKIARVQFQQLTVSSNPAYRNRMATRYEYGRRCFLNDSRIANGNLRRVDVHSEQKPLSGVNGQGISRNDTTGKERVVSESSSHRLSNRSVGEYRFIQNHFNKLIDNMKDKHSQQGAFSNAGNNRVKRSRSRDAGISPSTDGVAIAQNANNNLLASMKGIVNKLNPLHHEELDNLRIDRKEDKADLSMVEYTFTSAARLAKKYKAVEPFFNIAKQAVTKQEQLRYYFNSKMNEIDETLGWSKLKNDPKFKERKEQLQKILFDGDIEGREYTNAELAKDGYGPEVIKAYRQMRSLLDYAWKIANDTKSRIKYHSVACKNSAFADAEFAGIKAKNPFAEIISKVKNADGTVTLNYKEPHTYHVAARNMTTEELDALKQDKDVHIQIVKQSAIPGNVVVTYDQRNAGLNKRGGYVPHVFHGWYVCKVDKDGKPMLDADGNVDRDSIMVTADSMSEAVKLGEKLAKQDKNSNYVVTPQTFSAPGAQEQAVVMGDYDYAKVISKVANSMTMSIADAKAMMDGTVKMKNRGRFYGYAMQRKGFSGYEQNVYLATMKYFNQTARYVALDPFKRNAISMYNRTFGSFDDDNVANRSATAKWIRKYISDMNGNPTWVEKMINTFLHGLGLGKERAGGRPALWIQQNIFTYPMTIMKLGILNPASSILNLTQLFNLYGAMGEKVMSGEAYRRLLNNGFKDTFKAMSDKNSALGKLLWEDLGLNYQIGMDISAGYSNAEVTGLGSLHGFTARMAGKSMYLFRQSDAFARGVTLLTAYNKALSEGKSKTEAIEYAKKINDKVNFDYSVADEPWIFRAFGPISKVLLQFKKYPVKQIELFHDFYLEGREAGLNKKQSALRMLKYMAPYMAMSGMMGIPFISLAGGLFSALMATASGDDDWDWEKKMKQYMIAEFGADSPLTQWWLYGGGAMLGINVGSRIGVGDFMGSDSYNSADGIGGLLWNQTTLGSTINQLSKQVSYRNYAEAVKAVNPTVGNILQAYKGEVRTTRGRMKYEYQNLAERIWRAIGFTPLNEAMAGDLASFEYAEKQEQTKGKERAVDDFLADPSEENAKRLNEYGVTPKTIQNEAARRTMNRHDLNQLEKEKAEEKAKKQKKKDKDKGYSANDYLEKLK